MTLNRKGLEKKSLQPQLGFEPHVTQCLYSRGHTQFSTMQEGWTFFLNLKYYSDT